MTRLDWYLWRTIAATMTLAVFGMVGMLCLFTFLEQTEDLTDDYTIGRVAEYVFHSAPRMFYETIPYSALIGCLAGLGMLANNSELVVMRAAGISTWRIAMGTMAPALVLVLIGVVIGELVLPDFERRARLGREQALSETGHITPTSGFWYREGDIYMHFDLVDQQGDIQGLSHYEFVSDRVLKRSLFAERASYDHQQQHWVLENVVETVFAAGGIRTDSRAQDTWQTTMTPELLNTEILVRPDKMSIRELVQKITYVREQGLNAGSFELGFWGKVLQPLATVALVFVAISFIFGPLREATMGMRIFSGLVIGILFKFLQNLLSPASLVFGFNPLIAVLLPILLCFVVGVVLFRRAG